MITDILGDFHAEGAKHPTERASTLFKASDAAPLEHVNLLKSMKVFMDAWPNQPTGTNTIRASGAHDLCPREFVLNYWQPKDGKDFDWKSQFYMSTGTAAHEYVQNYVIGPMGVLYGNWVNHSGDLAGHGIKVEGFHPDPELAIFEIQHQRPLTWRYKEYSVFQPHWRISGHLDGKVCQNRIAWIFANAKLYKKDPFKAYKEMVDAKLELDLILFELKTAGTFVFDKVTVPEDIADYYKMQASIYQALSGTWKTLFWYMKREDFMSKAFIYEYDKNWYSEAKKKAKIIWESIRDRTLPDSMMKCKLPTDARAKKCVHSEICWANARRLNWDAYVDEGIKRAEREGRKLLDLSSWTAEPKEVTHEPVATGE
jgi:hypothetical protein